MFVNQFLNNRQIGTKCRAGIRASDLALNLDHLISRFVCLKKDVHSIHGEECDVPPFSCKFRRDSQCDLLAVANEDGEIALYDTSNRSSETILKSFMAHHNAIFDICWLPDKCQLVSGSGDFCANLWDMNQFKLISTFRKHTASIKSVDVCHEQSAIFATGSRDGNINVWDTRDRSSAIHEKPSVNICDAHCRKPSIVNGKKQAKKDSMSSVSAVAFQDSIHLASAGVADGVVKIWDLRKTYVSNPKFHPHPKYQLDYAGSKSTGHGCTSIVFDSLYKTLYACTTGSKIFKFNCHSYSSEVAVYEGFRCATYFVKLALSNDDQYLLCGSSDDHAYIWKATQPGLPILQLHGHAAEVTSVTWSPNDITKLATCGDDNKIAIWKIANKEGIDKNVIHAEAEPYYESSKNDSPSCHSTDPSSVTVFNHVVRKISPQVIQTPSKPSARVITNFFSPMSTTPSPVQLSPQDFSPNSSSQGINENTPCKLKDKSPESSSQVLSPSNKDNIINHSLSDAAEKQSSPEHKAESSDVQNTFISAGNKENSQTRISPDILKQTNSFGQIKRKFSSGQSTPSVKRFFTDSSRKVKGNAKKDNKLKSGTGKTIMSYFCVLSSPEN